MLNIQVKYSIWILPKNVKNYHKKVYIEMYVFTFTIKEPYTNLMTVPEEGNI